MRIVFVGAVDFSLHCLREVLHHRGEVVGVLNPERQDARLNSDYADLWPTASEHGVPCYRLQKISDQHTVGRIQSLKPDVIFVFGFSQLVPKSVLDIPPLGCIGTHPALLPRNRGRHPLIWALAEGLSQSGLTFFFMDEHADSGDILWQKPFPVTPEDDAATLYDKIKTLASEGIQEFLPLLESGKAPRLPQNHALATYWRKRTKDDGELHWAESASVSYNLIRALTRPYPGAHTFLDGEQVVVWRSRLYPNASASSASPGEIVRETPDGLLVRCGMGMLELLEWECRGSVRLRPGTRLGSASL